MSPEASISQLPAVKNKPVVAKRFRVIGEKFEGPNLREFPIASTAPTMPVANEKAHRQDVRHGKARYAQQNVEATRVIQRRSDRPEVPRG